MTRRLHFGCDQNFLAKPWENYDTDVDIRKPLPFPIGSARFILAEHVIEHVSFRDGVRFLGECLRILEPGGVLRLAFPDITRSVDIKEYKRGFDKFYHRQLNTVEDVWFSILTDWAHESCWTKEMAIRVLLAVGFEKVMPRVPTSSPHEELDRNVDLIWRSETTALEATR